ncbi:uncharacterized protein LOC132639565 [Lycium barbarum]|uniref:uncharacterized protein LOC132639565 n=1 Tax=Lycium barbarum TaxID=112863 RepID=UPI00293E2FFD|nr:uncharacterized protein LOC132639565 [Lycium barbarum]
MVFENEKVFRKALADYAIEYKVSLKLRPNQPSKVRAQCKGNKQCKWLCYAATDRDSGDSMIKSYRPLHKCTTSNKNKMCNTKWLAARFKDELIKQPSLRIWEIQDMCRDKLGLYVVGKFATELKCRYSESLWTNPGSSVWVRMDRESCPGKNLFVYFYICLDALKKGWMEYCRRIIGFDGCLLKGACKGELLVAVEDLQLGTGDGLPVMADMQKKNCYPMLSIGDVQDTSGPIGINNGRVKREENNFGDPEKSWVRAYIKEHSKCDVVENNMCETFNSWILSCRHKSIITMLEEIMRKIMTRQCDMIKFANTWISEISPMARLTLEDNKEMARGCKVLWNADVGFEIGEGEYRHTVNMSTKSCSCRTWQLRGIPCQHAVCAYYHIELEPEHFVEHWYRKDTFLKAYSHFIQPIPNMKMWPETNNPKIEPPA